MKIRRKQNERECEKEIFNEEETAKTEELIQLKSNALIRVGMIELKFYSYIYNSKLYNLNDGDRSYSSISSIRGH